MASLYQFIQKLYHNNLGVPVIMTTPCSITAEEQLNFIYLPSLFYYPDKISVAQIKWNNDW